MGDERPVSAQPLNRFERDRIYTDQVYLTFKKQASLASWPIMLSISC